MPTTPSSVLDEKFSKGMLLLAVLFFSWLLIAKNFVLDWTKSSEASKSSQLPNILMIVVDDLGYDDTSAINPTGLATPRIKQLAQEGVTFRRHYADSTCTPSRVAILTGRYPERSGFRPVGSEIPAEFSTIAEEMMDAGYATYLTGKWHVGEDRPEAWPENKGFENWFGFLNQWETSGPVTESSKGLSKPTYRNPMLRENGSELKKHKGHLTDILTDHTIRKIGELGATGKPWFLYHAFLAPHQPIQPAERYAEKFAATPEGKYNALITQLDDAIGRILQSVDRSNTLVIFVSDNGGTNAERNNNYPFYGKKGEIYEGSYRTPLIVSWPGSVPEGEFIDDVVMNVDLYPTLLAAVHRQPADDIDGVNLWPTLLGNSRITKRSRSWEVYSANVNTLSYSIISGAEDWRLSSFQGQGHPPALYQLSKNPAGDVDVAAQHQERISELTSKYWLDHWQKSLLRVGKRPGENTAQIVYEGFDAMRTPYRYGFSIGLEIGPLPPSQAETSEMPYQVLAGQEDIWELRFVPGSGIKWHMGKTVLRDANFEPSRCNAIVLTGYFQPKGHLTTRDLNSQIKLYSSGFLRDTNRDITFGPAKSDNLHTPTFVNFGGKATFSNMALSSFSENYEPNIVPQFRDLYAELYKEQKLSLSDVSLMNEKLCQ